MEVQIENIVGQVFRLHYPGAEYAFALAFSAVPIVIIFALAFCFAGLPLGLPPDLTQILRGNLSAMNVVAGGTGALVWSVYELVERYRSRDLPPESFFSPGLRMIIVGAVGAIVGALVNERIAAPVAFGIGALPLATVLEYVARRTRRQLGIPEPTAVQSRPSFESLQGWDANISERLARAGVSSVQALACANQFELYVRTNLEWRIILDLSDQALLAIYVGERLDVLRPFGIRTAVELAELDWSEDEEYFKGIDRDALVKSIAVALQLEELQTRHLIRSISNDATVDFLASLWSDEALPEDEDEPGEQASDGRSKAETGAAGSTAGANPSDKELP